MHSRNNDERHPRRRGEKSIRSVDALRLCLLSIPPRFVRSFVISSLRGFHSTAGAKADINQNELPCTMQPKKREEEGNRSESLSSTMPSQADAQRNPITLSFSENLISPSPSLGFQGAKKSLNYRNKGAARPACSTFAVSTLKPAFESFTWFIWLARTLNCFVRFSHMAAINSNDIQ